MQCSSQTQPDPQHVNRTLVIMAKAPRLGGVKSRLAQNLSPLAVVELYRCLLDDTVSLAQSLEGVDLAIMCPTCDVEDLSREVGNNVPVIPQTGEGLAAALTSVFAQFATGERRVVALDSDSPHLPSSVIVTAFDVLASSDLVVGPTHDGGYYLVGAAASYPGLFASSGMGTRNALEALLLRARELGLSVGFTEPFYDIDVEDDLKRLAAELQLAPERAPGTANWLTEWRRAQTEDRASIGAR